MIDVNGKKIVSVKERFFIPDSIPDRDVIVVSNENYNGIVDYQESIGIDLGDVLRRVESYTVLFSLLNKVEKRRILLVLDITTYLNFTSFRIEEILDLNYPKLSALFSLILLRFFLESEENTEKIYNVFDKVLNS